MPALSAYFPYFHWFSWAIVQGVMLIGSISAFAAPSAVAAEDQPPRAAAVDYDAATDYPAGAVVRGTDGNAYRAVRRVKAKDPTTADESAWQLAHVAEDVVLDVPGRFKTIPAAWSFLSGARIAAPATVKVLLAPGTYKLKEELPLGHAYGGQIVIAGVGPKPDRCSIEFAGTHGIAVRQGNSITLERLTISEAGRQPAKNLAGLLLTDGATAIVKDCAIKGFWSGFFVDNHSSLRATGCTIETGEGWTAVDVRNSSSAVFVDCRATRNLPAGSTFEGGAGFIAYANSSLYCDACAASGWPHGFHARCSSSAVLNDCTAKGNKQIGACAWQGASLAVNGGTFSGSEIGIHVDGATSEINGATVADNKTGLQVFGTAYAVLAQKRSTFRGNAVAVLSNFGGKTYGMPPVYEGNDEDAKAWAPGGGARVEEQFLWNR
ncbi:MAG: Right handed beta helix region [Planctomycetota bacterium]|jgi:hypothetical protein